MTEHMTDVRRKEDREEPASRMIGKETSRFIERERKKEPNKERRMLRPTEVQDDFSKRGHERIKTTDTVTIYLSHTLNSKRERKTAQVGTSLNKVKLVNTNNYSRAKIASFRNVVMIR